MRGLGRRLFWVVVVLAVAAGLARLYLVDVWTVPDDPHLGASVQPTLASGDVVLALTRHTPAFGDLVRCADPEDPAHFVIGRVAALGGDELQIDAFRMVVNGQRFDAERACAQATTTIARPNTGAEVALHCDQVRMGGRLHYRGTAEKRMMGSPTTVRVPPGKVFLLSDDRTYHSDSRDYGILPVESCTERIFFRLWGKDGWSDERRRLSLID